jgi:hypothetical protein
MALALYTSHAVANGLRTDHPIPGLPLVDDSHIPVDESAAIEAIGRHPGGKTWGRDDRARPRGRNGWVAYTTDPIRHDLAWVVRWHPDHGRSVILYRDEEAVTAYTDYVDGPLLFRSGGYWWDGSTWYRPSRVIDWAGEDYYRRDVPGATTIAASAILATGDGDATRATLLTVAALDPDAPYEGRWNDDLALWAEHRDGRNLDRCVTGLTAPELAAENLIGAPGLAEITGIAPSTLRAYIARGEGDVPLPQAVIGGRSLWSRPVAGEYAEQRQRDPDAIEAALSASGQYGQPLPTGQAELAATLSRSYLAGLWDYRPFRNRWALRWRNKNHVREVADGLANQTASYVIRTYLPSGALHSTLVRAFLQDLEASQKLDHDRDEPYYGVTPKLGEMLGWFARQNPNTAGRVISEVTGEAERELGIPRDVTEKSIRASLDMDGGLGDSLNEFLRRVMTPGTDSQNR